MARIANALVDVRAALYALVEPRRAVLLLVDRDRESLAAAVILSLDEGDVEAIRVSRETLGACHAFR